jgi:uncharacterized protein
LVTTLYLMPTERCNCVCNYCYLEDRTKVGDPALFRRITESFIDGVLLDPAAMISRPQIRFSGGEPWLEPVLLCDVARSFLDRIPDGWVVVNTNGTLLSDEYIRPFRGDNRFKSVVSLDGPRAIHDARRILNGGDSAFEEALKGIRLLQEFDLPVYVNAVIDDFNLDGLPDLMDLVSRELALDSLSLSLLLSPEDGPDPVKRFDTLRRAYSIASEYDLRLGGHHRLLLGHLIPGLECGAGINTVLIDASGGVNACQRFVGRHTPDSFWTEGFDWKGFTSRQNCVSVCRSEADRQVGDMLYDLYSREYPDYLSVDLLDRVLFGVIP